jgi:hypothetical protein
MYSSRGGNAYGQQQQQQYSGQSAYGQNLGSAYPGSSAGVPEAASQQSMAARHASMLGGAAKETDLSGYRGHASAGTHYGGQYSSVYNSAGLTSGQQVPSGSKASGPSALEGRTGYGPAMQQSPKFKSGEYAYGQKSEQLLPEKISDYASAADRRQYSERLNSYMGRDLQSEPASRYADPIAYSHQQKGDIYDRLDQSSLLQRESLLKAQSLQSAALDGGSRQADYLAAMGSSLRHPPQDLLSYGGRVEAADPRTLLGGGSSLHTQAPSILGAAPRRNVEELVYAAQASSNSGYGVSLPPGREYATGKGLHGSSLDPDYPVGLLPRGSHPRLDDRKDDRGGYARELERREEERRRELLREREKERERERERDRERERERERERKRERERREKERDRELKIARRERTPIRISRDRRGSSATKEGSRPLRRDSPPRRDASHRRRSPVKEKRREYICKVYSSSLVDAERGYLSIDKRYPRLFISPEFSKVVVHWPKEDLKLSIHTPVSFEHDFVEEDTLPLPKEQSFKPIDGEAVNPKQTVWNAKLILMSGLSHNAIEELSSERNYEDRIPHYCNMLRFALLKKDKSFMAIGGPWDTIDGGDPSVDDSSLVQTATRYAKDVTGLDLSNCHKWNRFLEIHYDRLGKDGLFSHKEVTVLYVPDLSECLTSLDAWREQWLSHKKAVAERERQLALKKEKSREKKEVQKDEEPDSAKDVKKDGKLVKGKEIVTEKAGDENGKKAEKTDEVEAGGAASSDKKEQTETPAAKTPIKSVKKKIVKKIVKKVADKKDADKSEKKDDNAVPDIPVPQDEAPSSTPAAVKTFARKKVTKKTPVVKVVPKKKVAAVQDKVKSAPEGDQKEKPDSAVKDAITVKSTIKKKVIKRVPKRKVSVVAEAIEEVSTDTAIIEKKEDEAKVVTNAAADNTVSEVKSDMKTVPKKKAKTTPAKKDNNPGSSSKTLKKNENEEKSKEPTESDKKKVVKKDDEYKKEKSKETDRLKADKEKEKKRAEEPPRHPGLILQTKGTSDSKTRSLSLSLDSLMDYSDKDLEESTFELSLFAETLYEMLQYQMGCRLLTFLQKLRIKFVTKRNQRKRQRELSEKENEKKSSPKRPKTDEANAETKLVKSEKEDEITKDEIKKEDETKMEEDNSAGSVKEEKTLTDDEVAAKVKTEEETDEEDPEEEEEEEEEDNDNDDEEMEDANEEENADGGESEGDQKKSEEKSEEKSEKADENDKETADTKPKLESGDSKKEVAAAKAEKVKSKKETPVADKELLQAFRFFDRNRVGFVRVEDLRLIIHNLGKFMSHRDVKELVQSALLESSTGRDDRILYNKLVRMTDI